MGLLGVYMSKVRRRLYMCFPKRPIPKLSPHVPFDTYTHTLRIPIIVSNQFSCAPSPSPGSREYKQSTVPASKTLNTMSPTDPLRSRLRDSGFDKTLPAQFFPDSEFLSDISLADDLSQIHLVHLRNLYEDSYSSPFLSASSSSASLPDQRSNSPAVIIAKHREHHAIS